MYRWTRIRTIFSLLLLVFAVVVIYNVFIAATKPTYNPSIFEEHIGRSRLEKYDKNTENGQKFSDIKLIIHMAEKIKRTGKPVLIAVINDAYVPFAQSWLCNTVYMGIHSQVIIVVTDVKSRETLLRQWPNVNIVSLPGGEEFNGNQEYTHAGYIRITSWRTRILMELIRREVELLLFEVDCLWLANPIPETQKQGKGYDVVGIKVAERPGLIGYGYLYLVPNPRVLKLWNKLTEMLVDLLGRIRKLGHNKAISEGDNDQMYLSGLINKKYADIRVKLLDLDLFPDGKWYTWKETVRRKMHPLLINNNWVIGNKPKIDRAKKWNHWFWDSEHESCDLALVNRTVY